MSDCIFCKIASKEIPSRPVYDDDYIYAFYDLEPQAPVHVLIITKKHLDSLDSANSEDVRILGHLLVKVKDIAKELGLENGYRLVANTGEDGMQTVQHLHFHLLGKRRMLWPPG